MSGVSRAAQTMPPTPKVLVNGIAQAGWSGASNTYPNPAGRVVTSGALAANTLADVFNITGAGTLKFIGVNSTDAIAKTMRLVLTLDGTVVFDYTSGTLGTGQGGVLIGDADANTSYALDRVPFSKSARLQWATSVAQTGGLQANLIYETN